MQLIFKYDLDRLKSYSAHKENNIRIIDEPSHTMLSFPEVAYFNYTFHKSGAIFTQESLDGVIAFYQDRGIRKHKVLVEASCPENNSILENDGRYQRGFTIAKTILPQRQKVLSMENGELEFVKVDHSSINDFTETYLRGFEAESNNSTSTSVYTNFKMLLDIATLDLFLLRHNDSFVGVNVLYHQDEACLLAGGAILPEYRNRGFHQQGIAYRIRQSLVRAKAKNIVAWAYSPSISLHNMLKLNMRVEEEFRVYEYCN